ncbi:unnamed protein product [Moneuplotes crassus]|uniref:Uncharacterized protein n=1 Tax=Euplotes crassus TaxID=5936 RepID=A0AAD1ULJ7_EUPCR|nr:unnamed protein product [Moneuplotes crassus]
MNNIRNIQQIRQENISRAVSATQSQDMTRIFGRVYLMNSIDIDGILKGYIARNEGKVVLGNNFDSHNLNLKNKNNKPCHHSNHQLLEIHPSVIKTSSLPSYQVENKPPIQPKLFTPIAKHVTPCSQVATQSCPKGPCSLFEFRISSFLIKRLDRCFYDELYYKLLRGKKSRGRPRLIKDVSEEALWKQVIDRFSRRANKRVERQRTDARNTSMCRNFKSVVDYILKYVGSKCRYKSNKIENYIESYAEAFAVGFVPIIFGGQSTLNKVKTFCEFIVFSYPAPKVKTILGKCMDEGLLHEAEYESLMSQLKERKNSSMSNFKKLASENSCFERLLLKILSKLPLMNLNDEEGYKKVLEKVLNIELCEPVFQLERNIPTLQDFSPPLPVPQPSSEASTNPGQ